MRRTGRLASQSAYQAPRPTWQECSWTGLGSFLGQSWGKVDQPAWSSLAIPECLMGIKRMCSWLPSYLYEVKDKVPSVEGTAKTGFRCCHLANATCESLGQMLTLSCLDNRCHDSTPLPWLPNPLDPFAMALNFVMANCIHSPGVVSWLSVNGRA